VGRTRGKHVRTFLPGTIRGLKRLKMTSGKSLSQSSVTGQASASDEKEKDRKCKKKKRITKCIEKGRGVKVIVEMAQSG